MSGLSVLLELFVSMNAVFMTGCVLGCSDCVPPLVLCDRCCGVTGCDVRPVVRLRPVVRC